MDIRKGDTVVILSGKDNYRNSREWIERKKIVTHKVLKADPKGKKLIVEGVNVASHHRKPRNQQEEGGIVQSETPIYASKVQLYCSKCGKGVRVGHKRVKKTISGKEKEVSVRYCRKCGAEL